MGRNGQSSHEKVYPSSVEQRVRTRLQSLLEDKLKIEKLVSGRICAFA
jgi:hypothetical protein